MTPPASSRLIWDNSKGCAILSPNLTSCTEFHLPVMVAVWMAHPALASFLPDSLPNNVP